MFQPYKEAGVFYARDLSDPDLEPSNTWLKFEYIVHFFKKGLDQDRFVYCKNREDFLILLNHWNCKGKYWKYISKDLIFKE